MMGDKFSFSMSFQKCSLCHAKEGQLPLQGSILDYLAMLRKDNSLSKVRFLATLDTFLFISLSSGK
jgi:hypothetical protein